MLKNINQLLQLRLRVFVYDISQNVSDALRQSNERQNQNKDALEFSSETVQTGILPSQLLLPTSCGFPVHILKFRLYNCFNERHFSIVCTRELCKLVFTLLLRQHTYVSFSLLTIIIIIILNHKTFS